MINDFLEQAVQVERLSRQFPGIPIVLDGLGHYSPVLNAVQWAEHYGAGSIKHTFAENGEPSERA